MKIPRLTASLFGVLVLSLFAAPAVQADHCNDPNLTWTETWSDREGETTYELTAPCKVYIGIPFSYTATVTDAGAGDWAAVASMWAIKDNGSTKAGGGWNNLYLTDGSWSITIDEEYSGAPIDHLLEFKFMDLGWLSGAHWWSTQIQGHITLDPYPPGFGNEPPVADAGGDVTIFSSEQPTTVLNGTATDPDGDDLTYRWLHAGLELKASAAVDAAGAALLDLGAVPTLGVGSYTLTLEVNDGSEIATDHVSVAIENSPPTAVGSGGTFEVGIDEVSVGASVADYDGDELAYTWSNVDGELGSGTALPPFGGDTVELPALVLGDLPVGTYTVTLEVSDGAHSVTEDVYVEVVDTTAPTVTLAAQGNTSSALGTQMTTLWPVNNKMVEVRIEVTTTDNSGEAVELDASIDSTGPASLGSDYYVKEIKDGEVVVVLRASRSGTEKNGRVYTVTVTATDPSGNSSSETVDITVPHDQGKGKGKK